MLILLCLHWKSLHSVGVHSLVHTSAPKRSNRIREPLAHHWNLCYFNTLFLKFLFCKCLEYYDLFINFGTMGNSKKEIVIPI